MPKRCDQSSLEWLILRVGVCVWLTFVLCVLWRCCVRDDGDRRGVAANSPSRPLLASPFRRSSAVLCCSNGRSDPFLKVNFDNFKTFKTEVVKKTLNPKWKFKIEFDYETRYPNKLDKKIVRIDCYDWDRVGGNDMIGSATVDLHTIATGPTRLSLTIRDGTIALLWL